LHSSARPWTASGHIWSMPPCGQAALTLPPPPPRLVCANQITVYKRAHGLIYQWCDSCETCWYQCMTFIWPTLPACNCSALFCSHRTRSIVAPNGLFMDMFGPLTGRNNDLELVARLNITARLESLFGAGNPNGYRIFGDSIYRVSALLCRAVVHAWSTSSDSWDNCGLILTTK